MEKYKWEPDLRIAIENAGRSGKGIQLNINDLARGKRISPLDALGELSKLQNDSSE